MTEAERERSPTMADVARIAGVSVAAVSYYFSGREEHSKRLSDEARQRIHGAVRSLGYVRNKTARHLRLQRTERICVLLPKLGIPFADKIVGDVEEVARRRGFMTVVVAGGDARAFRQVASEIESGFADGLIADAEPFPSDQLPLLFAPLIRARKPCLVLHSDAEAEQFSVLKQDRVGALLHALEHVLSQGHSRIAYIRNQAGPRDARTRAVQGFAARNSERMATPVVMDGGTSRADTVARAQEISRLLPRPTAIFIESDFTAVALIQELHRLGHQVPGDFVVVGCGNADEGQFNHPRLTTIGPEWLSLTEATEHVFDMIEGRASTPREFRTEWSLLLRESA